MSFNDQSQNTSDQSSMTKNSVVQHLESIPYPYRTPVFKIESKNINFSNDIEKDAHNVRIVSCDFNTNYYNISFNNNVLRWLRKVRLSLNETVIEQFPDNINVVNPYFDNQSPTDEWHLCQLYISPNQYESIDDIMYEINYRLNESFKYLFEFNTQTIKSYDNIGINYGYDLNSPDGIIKLSKARINQANLSNINGREVSYIIDGEMVYTSIEDGITRFVSNGIFRTSGLDNAVLTDVTLYNPKFEMERFKQYNIEQDWYVYQSNLNALSHDGIINAISSFNLLKTESYCNIFTNQDGQKHMSNVFNEDGKIIDDNINWNYSFPDNLSPYIPNKFNPVKSRQDSRINVNKVTLKTFPEFIGLNNDEFKRDFTDNYTYTPKLNPDLCIELNAKIDVNESINQNESTYGLIKSGDIRLFSINTQLTRGDYTKSSIIDYSGDIMYDPTTYSTTRIIFDDNYNISNNYPYYQLTQSLQNISQYNLDHNATTNSESILHINYDDMTRLYMQINYDDIISPITSQSIRSLDLELYSGNIKSFIAQINNESLTSIDYTPNAKLIGYNISRIIHGDTDVNISFNEITDFNEQTTYPVISFNEITDTINIRQAIDNEHANMYIVQSSKCALSDKYGSKDCTFNDRGEFDRNGLYYSDLTPERAYYTIQTNFDHYDIEIVLPDGLTIDDVSLYTKFVKAANDTKYYPTIIHNQYVEIITTKSCQFLYHGLPMNVDSLSIIFLNTGFIISDIVVKQSLCVKCDAQGYITKNYYKNTNDDVIEISSKITDIEYSEIIPKLCYAEGLNELTYIKTSIVINNPTNIDTFVYSSSTSPIITNKDVNLDSISRQKISNMYVDYNKINRIFTPITSDKFKFDDIYYTNIDNLLYIPYGTYKNIGSLQYKLSNSNVNTSIDNTYIFNDILDTNLTLTLEQSKTKSNTKFIESVRDSNAVIWKTTTSPIKNIKEYCVKDADRNIYVPITNILSNDNRPYDVSIHPEYLFDKDLQMRYYITDTTYQEIQSKTDGVTWYYYNIGTTTDPIYKLLADDNRYKETQKVIESTNGNYLKITQLPNSNLSIDNITYEYTYLSSTNTPSPFAISDPSRTAYIQFDKSVIYHRSGLYTKCNASELLNNNSTNQSFRLYTGILNNYDDSITDDKYTEITDSSNKYCKDIQINHYDPNDTINNLPVMLQLVQYSNSNNSFYYDDSNNEVHLKFTQLGYQLVTDANSQLSPMYMVIKSLNKVILNIDCLELVLEKHTSHYYENNGSIYSIELLNELNNTSIYDIDSISVTKNINTNNYELILNESQIVTLSIKRIVYNVQPNAVSISTVDFQTNGTHTFNRIKCVYIIKRYSMFSYEICNRKALIYNGEYINIYVNDYDQIYDQINFGEYAAEFKFDINSNKYTMKLGDEKYSDPQYMIRYESTNKNITDDYVIVTTHDYTHDLYNKDRYNKSRIWSPATNESNEIIYNHGIINKSYYPYDRSVKYIQDYTIKSIDNEINKNNIWVNNSQNMITVPPFSLNNTKSEINYFICTITTNSDELTIGTNTYTYSLHSISSPNLTLDSGNYFVYIAPDNSMSLINHDGQFIPISISSLNPSSITTFKLRINTTDNIANKFSIIKSSSSTNNSGSNVTTNETITFNKLTDDQLYNRSESIVQTHIINNSNIISLNNDLTLIPCITNTDDTKQYYVNDSTTYIDNYVPSSSGTYYRQTSNSTCQVYYSNTYNAYVRSSSVKQTNDSIDLNNMYVSISEIVKVYSYNESDNSYSVIDSMHTIKDILLNDIRGNYVVCLLGRNDINEFISIDTTKSIDLYAELLEVTHYASVSNPSLEQLHRIDSDEEFNIQDAKYFFHLDSVNNVVYQCDTIYFPTTNLSISLNMFPLLTVTNNLTISFKHININDETITYIPNTRYVTLFENELYDIMYVNPKHLSYKLCVNRRAKYVVRNDSVDDSPDNSPIDLPNNLYIQLNQTIINNNAFTLSYATNSVMKDKPLITWMPQATSYNNGNNYCIPIQSTMRRTTDNIYSTQMNIQDIPENNRNGFLIINAVDYDSKKTVKLLGYKQFNILSQTDLTDSVKYDVKGYNVKSYIREYNGTQLIEPIKIITNFTPNSYGLIRDSTGYHINNSLDYRKVNIDDNILYAMNDFKYNEFHLPESMDQITVTCNNTPSVTFTSDESSKSINLKLSFVNGLISSSTNFNLNDHINIPIDLTNISTIITEAITAESGYTCEAMNLKLTSRTESSNISQYNLTPNDTFNDNNVSYTVISGNEWKTYNFGIDSNNHLSMYCNEYNVTVNDELTNQYVLNNEQLIDIYDTKCRNINSLFNDSIDSISFQIKSNTKSITCFVNNEPQIISNVQKLNVGTGSYIDVQINNPLTLTLTTESPSNSYYVDNAKNKYKITPYNNISLSDTIILQPTSIYTSTNESKYKRVITYANTLKLTCDIIRNEFSVIDTPENKLVKLFTKNNTEITPRSLTYVEVKIIYNDDSVKSIKSFHSPTTNLELTVENYSPKFHDGFFWNDYYVKDDDGNGILKFFIQNTQAYSPEILYTVTHADKTASYGIKIYYKDEPTKQYDEFHYEIPDLDLIVPLTRIPSTFKAFTVDTNDSTKEIEVKLNVANKDQYYKIDTLFLTNYPLTKDNKQNIYGSNIKGNNVSVKMIYYDDHIQYGYMNASGEIVPITIKSIDDEIIYNQPSIIDSVTNEPSNWKFEYDKQTETYTTTYVTNIFDDGVLLFNFNTNSPINSPVNSPIQLERYINTSTQTHVITYTPTLTLSHSFEFLIPNGSSTLSDITHVVTLDSESIALINPDNTSSITFRKSLPNEYCQIHSTIDSDELIPEYKHINEMIPCDQYGDTTKKWYVGLNNSAYYVYDPDTNSTTSLSNYSSEQYVKYIVSPLFPTSYYFTYMLTYIDPINLTEVPSAVKLIIRNVFNSSNEFTHNDFELTSTSSVINFKPIIHLIYDSNMFKFNDYIVNIHTSLGDDIDFDPENNTEYTFVSLYDGTYSYNNHQYRLQFNNTELSHAYEFVVPNSTNTDVKYLAYVFDIDNQPLLSESIDVTFDTKDLLLIRSDSLPNNSEQQTHGHSLQYISHNYDAKLSNKLIYNSIFGPNAQSIQRECSIEYVPTDDVKSIESQLSNHNIPYYCTDNKYYCAYDNKSPKYAKEDVPRIIQKYHASIYSDDDLTNEYIIYDRTTSQYLINESIVTINSNHDVYQITTVASTESLALTLSPINLSNQLTKTTHDYMVSIIYVNVYQYPLPNQLTISMSTTDPNKLMYNGRDVHCYSLRDHTSHLISQDHFTDNSVTIERDQLTKSFRISNDTTNSLFDVILTPNSSFDIEWSESDNMFINQIDSNCRCMNMIYSIDPNVDIRLSHDDIDVALGLTNKFKLNMLSNELYAIARMEAITNDPIAPEIQPQTSITLSYTSIVAKNKSDTSVYKYEYHKLSKYHPYLYQIDFQHSVQSNITNDFEIYGQNEQYQSCEVYTQSITDITHFKSTSSNKFVNIKSTFTLHMKYVELISSNNLPTLSLNELYHKLSNTLQLTKVEGTDNVFRIDLINNSQVRLINNADGLIMNDLDNQFTLTYDNTSHTYQYNTLSVTLINQFNTSEYSEIYRQLSQTWYTSHIKYIPDPNGEYYRIKLPNIYVSLSNLPNHTCNQYGKLVSGGTHVIYWPNPFETSDINDKQYEYINTFTNFESLDTSNPYLLIELTNLTIDPNDSSRYIYKHNDEIYVKPSNQVYVTHTYNGNSKGNYIKHNNAYYDITDRIYTVANGKFAFNEVRGIANNFTRYLKQIGTSLYINISDKPIESFTWYEYVYEYIRDPAGLYIEQIDNNNVKKYQLVPSTTFDHIYTKRPSFVAYSPAYPSKESIANYISINQTANDASSGTKYLNTIYYKDVKNVFVDQYETIPNEYVANVIIRGKSSVTNKLYTFRTNLIFNSSNSLSELFSNNLSELTIQLPPGLKYILNGVTINNSIMFRSDGMPLNFELIIDDSKSLTVTNYVEKDDIKDPNITSVMVQTDYSTDTIYYDNQYNKCTKLLNLKYTDDTSENTITINNIDNKLYCTDLYFDFNNESHTSLGISSVDHVLFDFNRFVKDSPYNQLYPNHQINGSTYSIYSGQNSGTTRSYIYCPYSNSFDFNTCRNVEYVDSELLTTANAYKHSYIDNGMVSETKSYSTSGFKSLITSELANTFEFKYDSNSCNKFIDKCLYLQKSDKVKLVPSNDNNDEYVSMSDIRFNMTDDSFKNIFDISNSGTNSNRLNFNIYVTINYARVINIDNLNSIPEIAGVMKESYNITHYQYSQEFASNTSHKPVDKLAGNVVIFSLPLFSKGLDHLFTDINISTIDIYTYEVKPKRDGTNFYTITIKSIDQSNTYIYTRYQSGTLYVKMNDTEDAMGTINTLIYLFNTATDPKLIVTTNDTVNETHTETHTDTTTTPPTVTTTETIVTKIVMTNHFDITDNRTNMDKSYYYPYEEPLYTVDLSSGLFVNSGSYICRTTYLMNTGLLISELNIDSNNRLISNSPFCKIDVKYIYIAKSSVALNVKYNSGTNDFNTCQLSEASVISSFSSLRSLFHFKVSPLKLSDQLVHQFINLNQFDRYLDYDLKNKNSKGPYINYFNKPLNIFDTNTDDGKQQLALQNKVSQLMYPFSPSDMFRKYYEMNNVNGMYVLFNSEYLHAGDDHYVGAYLNGTDQLVLTKSTAFIPPPGTESFSSLITNESKLSTYNKRYIKNIRYCDIVTNPSNSFEININSISSGNISYILIKATNDNITFQNKFSTYCLDQTTKIGCNTEFLNQSAKNNAQSFDIEISSKITPLVDITLANGLSNQLGNIYAYKLENDELDTSTVNVIDKLTSDELVLKYDPTINYIVIRKDESGKILSCNHVTSLDYMFTKLNQIDQYSMLKLTYTSTIIELRNMVTNQVISYADYNIKYENIYGGSTYTILRYHHKLAQSATTSFAFVICDTNIPQSTIKLYRRTNSVTNYYMNTMYVSCYFSSHWCSVSSITGFVTADLNLNDNTLRYVTSDNTSTELTSNQFRISFRNQLPKNALSYTLQLNSTANGDKYIVPSTPVSFSQLITQNDLSTALDNVSYDDSRYLTDDQITSQTDVYNVAMKNRIKSILFGNGYEIHDDQINIKRTATSTRPCYYYYQYDNGVPKIIQFYDQYYLIPLINYIIPINNQYVSTNNNVATYVDINDVQINNPIIRRNDNMMFTENLFANGISKINVKGTNIILTINDIDYQFKSDDIKVIPTNIWCNNYNIYNQIYFIESGHKISKRSCEALAVEIIDVNTSQINVTMADRLLTEKYGEYESLKSGRFVRLQNNDSMKCLSYNTINNILINTPFDIYTKLSDSIYIYNIKYKNVNNFYDYVNYSSIYGNNVSIPQLIRYNNTPIKIYNESGTDITQSVVLSAYTEYGKSLTIGTNSDNQLVVNIASDVTGINTTTVATNVKLYDILKMCYIDVQTTDTVKCVVSDPIILNIDSGKYDMILSKYISRYSLPASNANMEFYVNVQNKATSNKEYDSLSDSFNQFCTDNPRKEFADYTVASYYNVSFLGKLNNSIRIDNTVQRRVEIAKLSFVNQYFEHDISNKSESDVYSKKMQVRPNNVQILSYYRKYLKSNYISLESISSGNDTVKIINNNIGNNVKYSDVKSFDPSIQYNVRNLCVNYVNKFDSNQLIGSVSKLDKLIVMNNKINTITSLIEVYDSSNKALGIGFTSTFRYLFEDYYVKNNIQISPHNDTINYANVLYSNDDFTLSDPSVHLNTNNIFNTYSDSQFIHNINIKGYHHLSNYYCKPGLRSFVTTNDVSKFEYNENHKSANKLNKIYRFEYSVYQNLVNNRKDNYVNNVSCFNRQIYDDEYLFGLTNVPCTLNRFKHNQDIFPTSINMDMTQFSRNSFDADSELIPNKSKPNSSGFNNNAPLINKCFRIAASPNLQREIPLIYGINLFDYNPNNLEHDYMRMTFEYNGHRFRLINIDNKNQVDQCVIYTRIHQLCASSGMLNDGLMSSYCGDSLNKLIDDKNSSETIVTKSIPKKNFELLYDEYFETIRSKMIDGSDLIYKLEMYGEPNLGLGFEFPCIPVTSDPVRSNTESFLNVLKDTDFSMSHNTIKLPNIVEYNKKKLSIIKDEFKLNNYNTTNSLIDDFYYHFTIDDDLWKRLGYLPCQITMNKDSLVSYTGNNTFNSSINDTNVDPTYIIKGKYYSEQLYTGPILTPHAYKFTTINNTNANIKSKSMLTVDKGIDIRTIDENIMMNRFMKNKHVAERLINLTIPTNIDVKITQNEDIEKTLNETNRFNDNSKSLGTYNIIRPNDPVYNNIQQTIPINTTINLPTNGNIYVYLTSPNQRYPIINSESMLNIEYIK